MKSEQRLLTVHECGEHLLVLVHRGPSRVEHLLLVEPGRLGERIRAQGFYEELRYAWPAWAAQELGLQEAPPSRLLAPCREQLESLVHDLCSSLAGLLAERGPHREAGGEQAGQRGQRQPLPQQEPPEQRGAIGLNEGDQGDPRSRHVG